MSIPNFKQLVSEMPDLAGVYQFFDINQQALYVGKAKNLKKRLKSYTDPNRQSTRINKMLSIADHLEIISTTTEVEALLLECNLIKKLMPRYNILLRDDKSFPYILITNDHQYGQITRHRGKRIKPGNYFGPFASGSDVYQTIDILKKSFLLRSCSDSEFKNRKKPCLEYQIKRCSGPCVGLINKDEYDILVTQAVNFLNGKSAGIQQELAEKMQAYSGEFQYEKAAILRDRIKALCAIQAKQNINLPWLENADVITLAQQNNQACLYISFYRSGYNYGSKPYFMGVDGESEAEIISAFLGQFYLDNQIPKNIILSHRPQDTEAICEFLSNLAGFKVKILQPKNGNKFNLVKDYLLNAQKYLQQKLSAQISNHKILIELKKLFDLSKIPQRIEVYDNSHISGQYMVGAMICAGEEGFIKNAYRKFNIRIDELEKHDDTAILKQVLTRRFKNLAEENKPDLIIIDGGKGQLSAAEKVFADLGIKDQNYIAMSKGENRNAGEEYFHQTGKESFTLPKNSSLMYYLQRLRDEAHRFAIGAHRNRRAKSITKSELDGINDIGKSRKMILLNHFGSVKAIKEASLEDFYRVPGIGKNIAEKIKNYFEKV